MKAFLKPLLLSAGIAAGLALAVTYSSCQPDKCKAIACAYDGTCEEGMCKCKPGYEGSNCETITRKKFIGLWSVREEGSVSPLRQYPISITGDSTVTNILIKNLYNYFNGSSVRAYVQGDTIIIPNQQLMGKVVFGKGYLTSVGSGINNTLIVRYEVVDVATQLVDDFGYYEAIDNSKPSVWTRQ